MATKIRLQRFGHKDYAFYQIVIADSRAPRDGKFIERIGSYNPNTNPATINLNFERALYWLTTGAQPTDTVRNILSKEGVLMKKHLLGGVKKGAFTEEVAEQRFEAWLKNKKSAIDAEKAKVSAAKDAAAKKRLEEETEKNKAKAEVVAAKKAAEAAAKAEAEAAAKAEEEANAVAEAPATEEATAAATEEATDAATDATDAEATDAAEDTTAASDKTWVVATDTVFKPFEYTNSDNEFVGIDVDILAAVAEDQGFKYDLQSLGWDAAVAAVQAGQADAIMAGASITQERKDNGWIFSDGYYNATQTFVVAQGSDVKSFEDLKGKNVAVKNGTQGADYANSLKDQYGFTVTVFEDSPTMYQDVILGNSAACVEDTPIIKTSIKEGELALEVPEGMENEGADYGVGIMNADNQEFLDMFNAGLANIKANGKYDEIIAKYLD